MDNRSLSVDIRREVPGLHPGLNDLIRVLGKQAHCASRTLIVCEPVCPKPNHSESKYHKNCGSPKKGRSWDSLCRPSSLWSPVRPETYYYDCFFYRQYPDRDSEYQEIEEKYNAIKQQKLNYSPPECDEDQIKAIVGGVKLNKAGGAKYTTLGDMSKSSTGKGARGWKKGEDEDDWFGPGPYKNKDYYGESSMGSARNPKYPPGGSNRDMDPDGDSVPCSELAEIRDLLKKSDRETIRRMQEMLTLMKELSVRDICRATCDGSSPGGKFKVGGPKSVRSEDDLYTAQGSKTRLGQVIDPRKRKADLSDYELQDEEMRYQQRAESMRQSGEPDGYRKKGSKRGYQQRDDDYEPDGSMKGYKQRDDEYGKQGRKKGYQQKDGDYGQQKYDDYGPQGPQKSYQRRIDDDYGPQGRKKGYQQRNNDYEPEGSMKGYQQRDDDYGPRELNKPYQRYSDTSKRKRGKYGDADADNYDDVDERQETSYRKGKSSKKNKRGADDGRESIRSSQQRGSSQRGKKSIVDDGIPADFYGEHDEDNAGSQLDLDIQEPRSLQRHLGSTSRSRGKVGDDNESLASTSSDRSRTSARGERPSSKGGKRKDRNAVSESDTDETDSSSIYSESSTTDTSRRTKDGESDFESSDMDDFESPGKASSSRSLKRHQDSSASSSQASLSAQGSAASLGRTQSKDRSRPGLSEEQKSPKQSRLPGSAIAGAPDQPGSGANYKIPVGKKNVPLTVHEVVELSNKITDVLVLEIINELIRQGLYSPPSSRYLQEPGATMPRTYVEGSMKPSSSSRQKLNEQRASDGRREPPAYKQTSRDANMMSIGSPTRLSTIDESSSRTGLSKEASRKDGSARDNRQREPRRSGESRRSSYPRHSKSLSPSTSSRRRSSSCRLEIERRAKSEGDRYKETLRPGDVVPPKPWERRLSSQMKADSMRDSSKVQAKGRSDMPESRGASMSSQRSKTGSYKPSNTQSDPAPLRNFSADGSYPGRPPTLPGSRQNLPDSSPRSTWQYEGPLQDRSDMPGSRGASVNSQMSKTGSYRGLSTRSDQASLKDGSLPGRSPTLPGSRQNLQESSPRSTRQYEGQPQDRSGMPGSRGASINSQMSKTASYRSQGTRPELASLKDGSLPGRSPTLPGSRQNLQEISPRSTRQYEGQPQDRSGMPGSRGASINSQMSKTASYRSQITRPELASLKDGSLPRSHQTSISSQMSKQSDKQRPPYDPGKTDSRQRDIQRDGSLSRTRIEKPMGPGKTPSGPRFPRESSRPGILKESSLTADRIPESEPLPVVGQVPLASRFQPDKIPSSQRIMNSYISDQPMMEEEPSKGRLVRISRPGNLNVDVPESEPIDARARPATSQRPPEPCEPDDFIATNYDTDNTTLYYARITNNAFPPVKETYHAAGFMLRSAYNYNIPPRSKIKVKTDLLMQLPRNCYGRIAPRKCLVESFGIDVGADVIDRDYKDNITVVLFNHGDQTFTVERGNKVAQLICESIHLAKVVENNNLLK